MKKKVLIVIYIVLIVITLKLFYNIILNWTLINKYNNNIYSDGNAKALSILNIIEPYVANYNYGNILYKKGDYNSAIEKYKVALKGWVPKNNEAKIRINYALAICKTVNLDKNDEQSINNAIKIYESAIDVLDVYINKYGNDNEDVNQLKKDIEDEIEKLKKSDKSKDSDEKNESEQREEEGSNETDDVQKIENKIQEIKQDATKDQKEVERKYQNITKDYNIRKKNW